MDNLQKKKNGLLNTFTIMVAMIQAARITHWTKNLSIYAALIFTGGLFDRDKFIAITLSFIAFNFATSASYIFNDFIDIPRDRIHPVKKFRPLASGKLPLQFAFLEIALLVVFSVTIAFSFHLLLAMIITYLVIQVFYTLIFKNLPVIDILIIASGFVIRVYSGAFVINAHLSVWFLLCVISTALFLASGKRRAELSVLGSSSNTRSTLSAYPPDLLTSYVSMFGNAAWMSWALFTFFESPQSSVPLWLILTELSQATAINKLLMITIPISIFGIMRYQSLIFSGRSESPEKVLLRDPSLVISVLIWIFLVIYIIYGGVLTT